MKDWEARGKERSPQETIAKAEQILDSLGYKTKMQEVEQDLRDCYSCRLTLDGIGGFVGTNGKGMSLELSHASAYGEMIERLSNRMFSPFLRFDDENGADYIVKGTPLYAISDKEQPSCVFALKDKIAKTMKGSLFFSAEDAVNAAITNALQGTKSKTCDKVSTLPFYSVREDKTVYIPSWIFLFTGSNGLAAGNTIEEALVEGISEIIERYCFLKVVKEEIVMPKIPREFLDKFPHITKIIDEIEERGNYTVRVLDASLGQGLPCVCGVVTDKETGLFGVKFGSQPNIAVALERIFTEALQGENLKDFCRTRVDFLRTKMQKRRDIANSLKVGCFNAPANLLMDTPDYEFKPWGTETKSNRQRACELIKILEDLGADVYIRDASYLGFPSVNIYAAGISELKDVDLFALNMSALRKRVTGYFRHIDKLTDEEVREIEIVAGSARGSANDDSINAISGLPFVEDMPGKGCEADFLYGACLWRRGEKNKAAEAFKRTADKLHRRNRDKNGFCSTVSLYVSGIAQGIEEGKVFEAVNNLWPKNAAKVREIFKDPANVLGKLYPVCEDAPLSEIRAGGSVYSEVQQLWKKLVAAENANPQSLDYIQQLVRESKK